MSRPVCSIIPATFLALSLVLSGCKTIYSDMYSPRRNHFIPVKQPPKKVEAVAPLTEPEPTPPPPGLPPPAPVPAAPLEPAMPADPAAPAMIPGL